MNFLRRLLGLEKRSYDPRAGIASSDPFLAEYFGLRGGRSSFGGPDAAVSSLAVAARCVSLISEGLAALPLPVYRKLDDGGRVEAPEHTLYRLLNDAANDDMSAFEFRVLMMGDLAQQGNAFARIERDGRGSVSALFYLPFHSVGVERLRSGRVRYRFTDPVHGTTVLLAEEVVHLRYRSRDGVVGISPLLWAQDAVGLAMAQAELADSQAKRGLVPDVVFSTDAAFEGDLADQAFRRLKEQLSTRMAKLKGDGDPILLEAGLKPHQLAPSGREAQFHEARVLSLESVATIYGVPLSVVGLGKNASYGSLTEESRALVQNCLSTWAAFGEKQLALALLSTEARRTFTIEHDMSGRLRGDMFTRLQSYEIGVRSGIYSANECRVWEGMNRRAGGDTFLTPMNMAPAGQAQP